MAYLRTRDLIQSDGWCLAGSTGARLVPSVAPAAGDVVLDNRYVSDGLSPSEFVDYRVRAIDLLADEGATAPRMASIGLHARWSGQPARASALREILAHVVDRGDIRVARRVDIAAAFAAQVPPPAWPRVRVPSWSDSYGRCWGGDNGWGHADGGCCPRGRT